MIKAIIFDWGGVLIDNPSPGIAAHCTRALGVAETDFKQAQDMFLPDFQRGTLSEAQFWEKVCAQLKVALPTAPSLWGEAFIANYKPKADMFAFAANLQAKHCVTALLSNTELSPMNFFLSQHYPMFDQAVFSCAEGIIKPEPAIYQLALQKVGVQAEETIYIDDKPANSAAASNLGMHGIVFENPLQTIAIVDGMLS